MWPPSYCAILLGFEIRLLCFFEQGSRLSTLFCDEAPSNWPLGETFGPILLSISMHLQHFSTDMPLISSKH